MSNQKNTSRKPKSSADSVRNKVKTPSDVARDILKSERDEALAKLDTTKLFALLQSAKNFLQGVENLTTVCAGMLDSQNVDSDYAVSGVLKDNVWPTIGEVREALEEAQNMFPSALSGVRS